jgi:hypothetical protein
LGCHFDRRPPPSQFIPGPERDSPSLQFIIPPCPRHSSKLIDDGSGIGRPHLEILGDPKIATFNWIEGKGVSASIIVVGEPACQFSPEPAIQTPSGSRPGNEPSSQIVPPTCAGKRGAKAFDCGSVIWECRSRSRRSVVRDDNLEASIVGFDRCHYRQSVLRLCQAAYVYAATPALRRSPIPGDFWVFGLTRFRLVARQNHAVQSLTRESAYLFFFRLPASTTFSACGRTA